EPTGGSARTSLVFPNSVWERGRQCAFLNGVWERGRQRTMPDLIQPRTLKGFRDYPPALAIPRERLVDTARRVFCSDGFAPIGTPALEYADILVGKMEATAEIQRQLYRFTDQGGRDVALRFDLTVPFARFAAQHITQLGTPFKRYHIATVWRG